MKVQNSGFFMLELLISMAIMSIFWLIIAQNQGVAIQISCEAQKHMRALNLASNLLDNAINKQEIPGSQKQNIDGFKVAWNINPYNLVPLSNDALPNEKTSFYLLTVQVSWYNNNHEQSVQLTSGMVLGKAREDA